MVDTSHGYADLLALFPDNTARAIHPQSIRDLVKSFAEPVRGGGLDRSHVTPTDAFSFYAWGQHVPVAHGGSFYLSLYPEAPELTGYNAGDIDSSHVLVSDPLGLSTNPTDDAQEPYGHRPAGKYLKNIPQGSVWATHVHMGWEAGTWAPGDGLFMFNGSPMPNYAFPDDYHDDTAAGIWGYPQYAYTGGISGGWTGGNQQMDGDTSILPFYVADQFIGPWNFSAPYISQNSGETQYINNYQFDFWRII